MKEKSYLIYYNNVEKEFYFIELTSCTEVNIKKMEYYKDIEFEDNYNQSLTRRNWCFRFYVRLISTKLV